MNVYLEVYVQYVGEHNINKMKDQIKGKMGQAGEMRRIGQK